MEDRTTPDLAELTVQGQRQFARALTDLLDRFGAWLDRTFSQLPPSEPHQN